MPASAEPRADPSLPVALVTGGGRGIGRATALAFAGNGYRVVVAARTRAEVETVAEECAAIGPRAVPVVVDVTDRGACRDAVVRCLDTLGRLDVLVNNAGTSSAQKFTAVTDEVWRRTLDVNLTGAFHMTSEALPAMLAARMGRVIYVASIAGKIGGAYIAPYTASKHGVLGLMRALATEYARTGLTFNAVCPAYVDTPMTEGSVRNIMEKTGRTRDEALQTLYTPQGRLVTPEEVAALCLFLASPPAAAINGQAINVDGGQVPL